MSVMITLSPWFKRFTGSRLHFEIEPAGIITIAKILQEIGIPVEETGFVTLNGVKVEHSHQVREGDIIMVYPLIIGG